MTDIFLGSKITTDGDCSHEIKRHLLLGRKSMTSLDSLSKGREITLPTKVHLVKAMVFPVVMYGCESWTIKNTCTPVADSCWCVAEPIQYCKVISLQLKQINLNFKKENIKNKKKKKESWALKNCCFWTVVLEKTLANPLDCKEIQPVNPKGDQSWVFMEERMLKLKLQ